MNVTVRRGRISDSAILSISRDSAAVMGRLNTIESSLKVLKSQHDKEKRR